VERRCWSNVLKAGGAPWPIEKWGAMSRSASAGASGHTPARLAVTPEQAAVLRLEAERAALAVERARLEQAAACLEKCAQTLTEAQDAVLQGVEKNLMELVLKVATQVIHDEVTQNPELITNQVLAALAHVKEDGAVTVRIHPQMLDILRGTSPRLLESLGPAARLHFEPDLSIAPGGCILETPQQIVDARIENQLARIATSLKQDLSS
jgi:type III secretion protein L